MENKYDKNDFSFTYNARGYMVIYKGKNIGGAGIVGQYKGRGRAVAKQLSEYREQAERTISQLCNGIGHSYMFENIKKINAELSK